MAQSLVARPSRPAFDPLSSRFKVKFREPEALAAAQAMKSRAAEVQVVNRKRGFLSVRLPLRPAMVAEVGRAFDRQIRHYETRFGAEIYADVRYDMESGAELFGPDDFLPEAPTDPSLDDVLDRIHAPQAWAHSRGRGIAIAIVDTGVDGNRPEFPLSKRVGSWQPLGDLPWTDYRGHGTMCACIAAATRAAGGSFDGVAPEAALIACRTRFYETELTTIYDYLIRLVEVEGLRIVATNSFGLQTGTPPPDPATSDLDDALTEAIQKGVLVFFSAGNYHELAGGEPDRCEPNSIWYPKSRADLMTVAACKLDGSMWSYSSRGPGQRLGQPNTRRKPDVTAPTPENGRILYGGGISTLARGWGTSGACPQAAGLGALLLAKNGSLRSTQVFDAIRTASRSLGHGECCQGDGLIDCAASVESV